MWILQYVHLILKLNLKLKSGKKMQTTCIRILALQFIGYTTFINLLFSVCIPTSIKLEQW